VAGQLHKSLASGSTGQDRLGPCAALADRLDWICEGSPSRDVACLAIGQTWNGIGNTDDPDSVVMDLAAGRRRLRESLSPRRRPRWQRRILIAATALVVIGTAGIVLHSIEPEQSWLLGLAAFSPYLMLSTLLAVVLLAVVRYWIGVAMAIALLVGAGSTQIRLYVAETAPRLGVSVSTMTSNLKLGGGNPQRVVEAVRSDHVAVLMLEELTPQEQVRLIEAGLDQLLPYHVSDPRGEAAGTGLWSRYPLTDEATRTDFKFAFVSARVAIPGLATPPVVVATHMAGPWPSATDWSRDIARLPEVLKALDSAGPALVGGDFNASPDVAQFRHVLSAGFADAAEQAGAGMTRTFPADASYPPLIAIDHVLTRGAVATSAKTVEIPGSDHRALVATVKFPAG
jgi:endonuclease/exonuclease/phosphatase (EEP) superfamily protein YafD